MYYCMDCKRFVKGDTWECESPNHKMKQGEVARPFYREVRCELCGSNDLEEARKCSYCGEPTLNEYCEWCMDDAKSAVRHFIALDCKGDNIKKMLERIDLLQEACLDVWVDIKKGETKNERKQF